MSSTGSFQPKQKGYLIEDWMASYEDIILPPFQVRPVAVFTSDLNFIEYAKRNNYFVAVRITGSGMYDGEHFATVDNFHKTPNICKLYGPMKYTLTLQAVWRGYPFKTGKIELLTGIVIPKSILFKAEQNRVIYQC
jgi:hypothetical protein